MTRRKRFHPRRVKAVGLDANAEMMAVGWAGWWIEEAAASRAWWHGIATVHGDRLRAKWIAAAPGTRPAFDWVTRLPTWPLTELPDRFEAERKSVVIDSERYWYCGPPWQPRQVDILRECGEIDAAEYRRHREWVKAGSPFSYTLDDGWACSWLCSGTEVMEDCK